MQKFILTTNASKSLPVNGKPMIPFSGRQPVVERKVSDPSSASPKAERYPIPSFFEYRIKARDFDPL